MRYPVALPSVQDHLLTLTHPSPHIWVIELRNGPDSRLTKHLLVDAFLPALDHVELAWRNARNAGRERGEEEAGKGGLVITGNLSQNKFFSNGLELQAALGEPGFWKNVFYPWMTRILTFPMPTVAAINGHAFAGGWILATACDYRIMSSGKCWGSMNEVHLGSDFPHAIMVFLLAKLRDPVLLRQQLIEGHRWTPQELLCSRMVDELVDGGSELVLERAVVLAHMHSGNARTGVYGLIKKGMYRDVLEATKLDTRLITAAEEDEVARARLSVRTQQIESVYTDPAIFPCQK